MRLTDRDLEFMSWMNEFNIVTCEQIAARFGMSKRVAYKRLQYMVEEEYVIHERILHNAPGVFRLTYKGVQACGSDLSVVKSINMGTYHHDLAIVDVHIQHMRSSRFEVKHWWKSERRIRHEWGFRGVGQVGHVPDGLYYSVSPLSAQTIVYAIEVELSAKSSDRLEKIMKDYADGVIEHDYLKYFVPHDQPKVINAVKKAMRSKSEFFSMWDLPYFSLMFTGDPQDDGELYERLYEQEKANRNQTASAREDVVFSKKPQRKDSEYEIVIKNVQYKGKSSCEGVMFDTFTRIAESKRCRSCDLPLVQGAEYIVGAKNVGSICINRKCDMFAK